MLSGTPCNQTRAGDRCRADLIRSSHQSSRPAHPITAPAKNPVPPRDKYKVRCWFSGKFQDPSVDPKLKICAYSCSDGTARVYVSHIGCCALRPASSQIARTQWSSSTSFSKSILRRIRCWRLIETKRELLQARSSSVQSTHFQHQRSAISSHVPDRTFARI
jgi:hypothetical protein